MKTYYLFLLPAMMLAACSGNDDPFVQTVDENVISIQAVHPSASRATDTGFEKGDEIGVYVVSEGSTLQAGGNVVNNGQFTYSGSAWTPARTYYWNAGKHNVFAYYPFQTPIDDTADFLFQLPTDQSTDALYTSADLMWASATGVTASSSPVSLKFSHSLSKVVVNLEKSVDYTGELPTDFQVYIHGTYATAAVDLATGSADVAPDATIQSIKARKLSNTQYTAIVVPQRVASRRPLVEVVSGNVSYLLEGTVSFKQGYQATITITLTKSPEQVEIEIGGGIGSWD